MKKLLVVGDIITDRYTRVSTIRKAQEADIPVYEKCLPDACIPGGAANVALNAGALSCGEFQVDLSGITADVELHECDFVNWKTLVWGDSITKHRFVDNTKESILFRLDNKRKFANKEIELFEKQFLDCDLSQYSMIIISDYDKGTVTEKVIQHIKLSGVKTIVDSKRYDLTPFSGFYALNINHDEYAIQVSNKNYTTIESLFDFVIVTLGAEGAELRQYEKFRSDCFMYTVHTEKFPVKAVSVVDVTGCGDTFTAALAIGLMRDFEDIRNATRFANTCASLAVQKFGTTRISKWDFLKSLEQS